MVASNELGNLCRRGARVQDNGVTVIDEFDSFSSNSLFGLHVLLVHRQKVHHVASGIVQHSPSMLADYESLFFQQLQVLADGNLRDFEHVAEL